MSAAMSARGLLNLEWQLTPVWLSAKRNHSERLDDQVQQAHVA